MSEPEQFSITAEWSDGGVLLVATGELDLAASTGWNACVDEILGQTPSSVTVDLSATTFVDSSGLRLLLVLRREMAQRNASFALANISVAVARLLEVTGITDLVTQPSPGQLR
jgi:anti-anti-sigma factor